MRREAATPILFLIGAFLLYLPILGAPTYFDDAVYVSGSAFLRAPYQDFMGLLLSPHYFAATGERTWQPAVTAVNRLFVDSPVILRALSILLHALCAWLLSRLARSAWAGALFLVFPLAAESVFFASFKGHLLAAAAVLASLLAWSSNRRALSAGLLALGLLAKEGALVAGPLLFLRSVLLERRTIAETLRRLAPHALVAAVYLLLRFAWLIPAPPLLVPSEPRPLAAFAWYIGALAWPPAPGLFRALPGGDAWALLLLAPYAAALWRWRHDPKSLFLVLWLPAALLPFLHLVPFAAKSPVADRYLYLAAGGFCLALSRLQTLRARAALAVLALLWTFAAFKRALLYRDPPALAAAGAQAAPASAAAQLFHAQVLLAQDDAAQAARAARSAARLEPRDPQNWTWLGLALFAAKQDGAESAFRKALSLQETPQARANLGVLFEETGRPALALKEYERALELAPDWDKPRLLAAELRARTKRP